MNDMPLALNLPSGSPGTHRCLSFSWDLLHRYPADCAFWALFTICLLSRLYFYFNCKDPWLDEVMVAHGIFVAGPQNFLTGLFENDQSFPLGFGLINKVLAVFTSFGPHVIYPLPTVLGLLCVLLTYKITALLCRHPALPPLAVACYALLFSQLYYASEFKHYIYDVFFTLWLFLFALRDFSAPKNDSTAAKPFLSPRYPVLFVVTLLFSFPALFTCAAIFICQCLVVFKDLRFGQLRLRQFSTMFISYGLAALFAVAYYYLYIRNTASGKYAVTYWDAGYIPLDPTRFTAFVKDLLWPWYLSLFETLHPALTRVLGVLTLVLALPGLAGLYRSGRMTFALFALTLAVVLVAACSFYPLGLPDWRGARLSIYLAPLLIIMALRGLDCILSLTHTALSHSARTPQTAQKLSQISAWALLPPAIILALFINYTWIANKSVYTEQSFFHYDYVLNHFNESTDRLYIFGPAVHALRYYAIYRQLPYFPSFVEMNRDYLWQPSPRLDLFLKPDIFDTRGETYFLLSHYWGGWTNPSSIFWMPTGSNTAK